MKFKTGIKYLFLTTLIYLAISALDILLLRTTIGLIDNMFVVKMIIYGALLFLVNPLLTRIIIDILPFKPEGLKTDKGLDENLKREVKI